MKKTAKAAPSRRRAVHQPDLDPPPAPKFEVQTPNLHIDPKPLPTVALDRHTARSVETLREVVSHLTDPAPTSRCPLISIDDTRKGEKGVVFRTVTVVLAYPPSSETVEVPR